MEFPMTFDIHQIDELDYMSDEGAEKEFDAYCDELVSLFFDSSEGRKHKEQFPVDADWVGLFMDYGFRYLGYSIPTLTDDAVEELITDILPKKVSLQTREEAMDAIPELAAFWSFVKREYNLQNANSILKYLNSYSPDKFADSMFDPAKAGMAKSFFMSGQTAGFDMTDMKQSHEYMALYNASQMLRMEKEQKAKKTDDAKEKKKRKAEKAARKRNRKR
jgi:hypothetical protein